MLGLYVHIPFCSNKCYYCDFASYTNLDYLIDDYIQSLLLELEIHKDKRFNTIFIGGGTPSYLNENQLDILLYGINKKLNMNSILEFTVECNPGTLNYSKFDIMKNYGVNRLSIGLQSTNEDTLKFIGRIHSLKDFDESISFAHNVGFDNINADLIFGIPNEKMLDYKKTLNRVIDYGLTHISAYNLILEENTKFYNLYKKGKLQESDEELQLEMYRYTKYFLEDHGFKQYEISNYAKVNRECLHNLIYWNFDEYVGIGIGSHSFYGNKRFENTRNIKNYITMLKNNRHKYFSMVENSIMDNIEEYIIVGFRKNEGVDLEKFKNKFNIEFTGFFKENINKNILNGLLKYKDRKIALTSKGFELMNLVLKDFIK